MPTITQFVDVSKYLKQNYNFWYYLPYCSGLTIFYKNLSITQKHFALTFILTFYIPWSIFFRYRWFLVPSVSMIKTYPTNIITKL